MRFMLALLIAGSATAQTADQIAVCIPANEVLKSAQEQSSATLTMVRAYNSLPEPKRQHFKPLMDEAYASAMRLDDLERLFVEACG